MRSADQRFEYRDQEDRPVTPGVARDQIHRFAYRCRTRVGNWCSLNLRGRGHDIENKSWTWDGNFNAPTLQPSVNCQGCWHGFIEGGSFNNTVHQPESAQ